MIENRQKMEGNQKAVLVGLVFGSQTEDHVLDYLEELAFLAETAGAIAEKQFYQKLQKPNSKTYIGSGKVQEIRDYLWEKDIKLVIFDDELSGSQINNIEKLLSDPNDDFEVTVLDRSDLILDIFATRAKTAQAKLQVELAQYQYILPRLKGMWNHLQRQEGAIGSRGPGEKAIETDRRMIREKITLLRKRLAEVDKQASTQRKNREDMIRVSLVGYTNVGKSTIMEVLSKSDVFVEDKLFATLETTTRKVVFERTPFLLSDTVGFIRKLPHHLVESFKSTLDEVREADILVHVVDLSHPAYEDQINIVNETLTDLGAINKPTLMVLNKLDAYKKKEFDEWLTADVKQDLLKQLEMRWDKTTQGNSVLVSATNRENMEILRAKLHQLVKEEYAQRYPYLKEFY